MLVPALSRAYATGAIAVIGGLLAAPLMAQERERLSQYCREEIRDLCFEEAGPNRALMRACISEKLGELSPECATAIQERREQRASGTTSEGAALINPYRANPKIHRTVIYGDHPRQQVDVFEPGDAVESEPLVLFIHGGGWSMGDNKYVHSKPAYFTDSGYYFASAGYRLVPDNTVEDQAADLGAALQALRAQAASIGFDPDQIVLMGHSAGAHLAALLASDPTYAGDAFDAIKGVVLLDGAGYDIAANMAQAGPRSWQIYNTAFGPDPARQTALSPLTHVGGADAPNWLAIYDEERRMAKWQSDMLANALNEAGAQARAVPFADTDHSRINSEIGTEAGSAQTEVIMEFLGSILD